MQTLQETIQKQNQVVDTLKGVLIYQGDHINKVSRHSRLSKDDTVRSLKDKQRHVEELLSQQKQDIQQVVSSLSTVSPEATKQQLTQQEETMKRLSSDLQKLSSAVEKYSVTANSPPCPRVTAPAAPNCCSVSLVAGGDNWSDAVVDTSLKKTVDAVEQTTIKVRTVAL